MEIIDVELTKEEFRKLLKYADKNNLSTNEAAIKLLETGLYFHRILKWSQEGKIQNLDDSETI